MATLQEYGQRISELYSDSLEFSSDLPTVAEAETILAWLRSREQALRMMKREVIQDEKEINADYRDKSANAASGSSGLLSLFGQRKLAGQIRADAKRNVARERHNVIQEYDRLKLQIDELITSNGNAQLQCKNLIQLIENTERENGCSLVELASRVQTTAATSAYCTECGATLAEGSKFCQKCGTKVGLTA